MVHLGGAAHDPPGYDLRALIIGSEGTLAVVTEVTVRIMPRPEKVLTQLVVYDAVEDAARSVAGIIAAGIVPATLEMMDAPIIRAVEDSIACGYPRDAAAVLIIEVEGPAAGLDEQAAASAKSARPTGAARSARPPTPRRATVSGKAAAGRSGRWRAWPRTTSSTTAPCRGPCCPKPWPRSPRSSGAMGSSTATCSTPATATCTR